MAAVSPSAFDRLRLSGPLSLAEVHTSARRARMWSRPLNEFDQGRDGPRMNEATGEKRADFKRVADEVREAGRELTPPRAWLCPSLPLRDVAHRQIHSQDDSSREKPYGRLRVAKNRHDVHPPRGNREQRQSSPVSMTCQIERSTLSAGALEGRPPGCRRLPGPPARRSSQWPLSKSMTPARLLMFR